MNLRDIAAGFGDPYALATQQDAAYRAVRATKELQAASEEGRQNRLAAANVREVYRNGIGEAGLPEPGAMPTVAAPLGAAPGVAPAPAAAAKPTPRKSNLPTPSQATENQSDAESRRLAGKPTPAEAAAAGERPGRATPALEKAKRDAEMRRYEELRRLNQSIPVPNQSAAETARLNRSGDPDARPAQPALGSDVLTPEFFARQRQVESGGDPNAVSPKGAVGVMQTMPGTLVDPGFGVAPARDRSPAELQRVGEDYMRAMLAKFGNMRDALVAYNWGPGNAQKWLQAGGDVSRLPAETQGYLRKLLGSAVNAVVPSAQAAQPTPPTAQAAPQQLEFQAQQFAAAAPQVSQQVQLARMRLQQLNQLMRVTRDVPSLEKLNAEAYQQRATIFEGQLYDAATRAQAGDMGALSQLAQVVGIPFAQTPQGFVTVAVDPVTGNGRATSQPMDAGTFARTLFQRASTTARQAEAAAAQKRAEAQAKTQGEVAVEEAKGRNKLLEVMATSEGRLQEELLKNQLQSENIANVQTYGINQDQVVITRKDGRVFLMQPEKVVDGMRSPARLVPVQ